MIYFRIKQTNHGQGRINVHLVTANQKDSGRLSREPDLYEDWKWITPILDWDGKNVQRERCGIECCNGGCHN